jgi:beta-phosphoglucomutase
MKYKAVIFDLDGVICHTDKYHYMAWKAIADEIGVHFDKKINNRLRGVSRAESFEIILETYKGSLTPEQKRFYSDKKNSIYVEYLKTMTAADISDEVRHTLNEVRQKGLLMAIGSSSKNAPLILKQTGLEDMFDAISDGNNISKSKPDPEVFLVAAQYLHTEPSSCIVIEDADSGVQAAIAANMDCAAIGHATLSGLATYNLKRITDILNLLVMV